MTDKERFRILLPRAGVRWAVMMGVLVSMELLKIPDVWGQMLPVVSAGLVVLGSIGDLASTQKFVGRNDAIELNPLLPAQLDSHIELTKRALVIDSAFIAVSIALPTLGVAYGILKIGQTFSNINQLNKED